MPERNYAYRNIRNDEMMKLIGGMEKADPAQSAYKQTRNDQVFFSSSYFSAFVLISLFWAALHRIAWNSLSKLVWSHKSMWILSQNHKQTALANMKNWNIWIREEPKCISKFKEALCALYILSYIQKPNRNLISRFARRKKWCGLGTRIRDGTKNRI